MADRYLTPDTDALAEDILWDSQKGWNWLNPPYGNIRPWVEKAKALGDLPDEDYRNFVCVEAAIANDKAVTLTPGECARLTTRVIVAGA